MEPAVVITILCLATLVHGTLGFGTALVAMPLLTLTLGVQEATALVAFVILGTTSVILARSWRELQPRAAGRLLAGSLVGIPIGIVVLTNAPAPIVQRGLGGVLILVGLYNVIGARQWKAQRPVWAYVFGFASGLLGGAYNTNAPPAVVYGALRGWPPESFRANLQALFVPAAIMIWAGHGVTGLWTGRVVTYYLLFLPFGLLTLWFGQRLSARIPEASFGRLLYLVIALLGVALLI